MSTARRRVVITGMGINTPLGDELDTFVDRLLAGQSAITRWKFDDTSRVYSKVGGDLSDYDSKAKLASLRQRLPEEVYKAVHRLARKSPFSTRLTLLCAADAVVDAGLLGAADPHRTGVVVGGHNQHNNLLFKNVLQFLEEPEFIDPMLALSGLDTDEAATIGEALGLHGAIYTVGGACASTNIALRSAVDEVQHHDHDAMLVVGAPLDLSLLDLQAMAILGAITYNSFNDTPERASRPWDTQREGFVPSHGAGTLVVEDLEHALARGARIYAEILAVETSSDACHLPSPSQEGQVRTMKKALRRAGIEPADVDYVNAHATSTPLGDATEIRSIKEVFGEHAYRLRLNATKSMLGHTCWAAPVTETIAAVMQMQRGRLHPSINVDSLDPEVDLQICANEAVDHQIRVFMKNSFGFGGINCCSVIRSYDSEGAP